MLYRRRGLLESLGTELLAQSLFKIYPCNINAYLNILQKEYIYCPASQEWQWHRVLFTIVK